MKTFSNPGPTPSSQHNQLKANRQVQHARLEKYGQNVQGAAMRVEHEANRHMPGAGPQPKKGT